MDKPEITEKAYIIIVDLRSILVAQEVLRDVVTSINVSIPDEEYRAVMKLLKKWEGSLQNSFNIEG